MNLPNESAEYRQARDQLLRAEQELSLRIEEVARLRRQLPPGGLVTGDYTFTGADGPVPLASLFNRHSTLLLYSFMYGPEMEHACPMCSSFLDGVNAMERHLARRLEVAVVASSPYDRLAEFGRRRGWQLRLLSASGSRYQQDYYGVGEFHGNPSQLPMLNVFQRKNGEIRHFWATEMQQSPAPGQDPRHLDIAWPLWNLLDMTPEGRGDDFYPSLW